MTTGKNKQIIATCTRDTRGFTKGKEYGIFMHPVLIADNGDYVHISTNDIFFNANFQINEQKSNR